MNLKKAPSVHIISINAKDRTVKSKANTGEGLPQSERATVCFEEPGVVPGLDHLQVALASLEEKRIPKTSPKGTSTDLPPQPLSPRIGSTDTAIAPNKGMKEQDKEDKS